MTTSWFADYSAALDARDAREKAQMTYINACTHSLSQQSHSKEHELILSDTKLADRTAALEASAAAVAHTTAAPTPAKPSRPSTPAKGKSKDDDTTTPSSPTDALTRLRADLTSTQSARATLAARLPALTATLTTLQAQSTKDSRRIEELSRANAALERKVRDRDEEIREKGRLVKGVQDEMVSLEMQLNVAEQKGEALRRENEGLVERWMRRVGREAEMLNQEGGWG